MEPERRSIKETSSLSKSRKGPRTCYGATRQPESSADYKLAVHSLDQSDTLQGLAIKYGVTVEQIRRVNKLWTNDNIHILKTLNIPVKLTFGDGLTEATSCDDGQSISMDKKLQGPHECDSEESVDSGVHEVHHGDISIDVEGHSQAESSRTKRAMSKNEDDSLNSFLKKFDGDMKASIQKAKKQRSSSVPALINNLEANHEKERSKRHSQKDSNHVRLKSNRVLRTKNSSQSDSGSHDDLFEL
ncbi:lysM and putative peptidoglycan-binding domain-containing protein 2-like [Dendronephthya gigantea]|uniref:lysM and putative peptidoglycan-binding domain-containing protein 2-like n=1 Tax=Dendronephthya gigantea TaxID=151771 RepID=UPI001069BC29|nr:lysM and putative peptidoglycan-binding domain-containing protein 2-like [Dendronephthya gigantea]